MSYIFFGYGVKLSAVSNCPFLQVVSNCPVSNCPGVKLSVVSNCPRSQIAYVGGFIEDPDLSVSAARATSGTLLIAR